MLPPTRACRPEHCGGGPSSGSPAPFTCHSEPSGEESRRGVGSRNLTTSPGRTTERIDAPRSAAHMFAVATTLACHPEQSRGISFTGREGLRPPGGAAGAGIVPERRARPRSLDFARVDALRRDDTSSRVGWGRGPSTSLRTTPGGRCHLAPISYVRRNVVINNLD